MNHISCKIRAHLKANKITRRRLAAELGVSVNALYNYVEGIRTWQPATAIAVAAIIPEIELIDLLDPTGEARAEGRVIAKRLKREA